MSKLDNYQPSPEDKAAAELAKAKLAEPSGNVTATSKGRDKLQPDVQVSQALDGFSATQLGDQFQPDIKVTPPTTTREQNAPKVAKARPATNIDLAKLTESDLMGLDFIDAKSFDVPAMLQMTPKDPNIRFRWVNFKNYEGANYDLFKALGFVNATPQDVGNVISEHMTKEDGTIKWFDVILMKVPTLHIMGLYKKNIMRSLQQVGRWQPAAIEQAKRTVEHELGSDIWNTLKKEDKSVEFYAPSLKEMQSQDDDFKGASEE